MKKNNLLLVGLIFAVIFIVLGIVYGNRTNTLTINNKQFTLKYSNCNEQSVVCLNEYYLKNEYDNNWSELFTVVYSKNADNPIAIAATMANSTKISNIYVNKEENSAIVEFGILYKTSNNDVAIEQNIAKVMMNPYSGGVISQQYARRYVFDKNVSNSVHKKNMQDFNSTYINIINKIKPQKIYPKPLKKW